MSLKHDIEEHPEMWSKEIVAAVENLKNGKFNSKRKLRKFVNREISQYYYNELIERHKGAKKRKKNKKEKSTLYFYGIPLTKETFFTALFFVAIIIAICIFSDAIVIVKKGFWVKCSLGFLVLSASLYHYTNAEEKSDKDREIGNLKQEIRKLENVIESDKQIIDLLEKQLEKQNNSQQE